MSIKLDRIIDDKKLAWNAASFNSEKNFSYRLPREVLFELKEKPLPETYDRISSALENFPQLKKATSEFYTDHLKNGYGFGLVAQLSPDEFSRGQQEIIYWMICNYLGNPLPQNTQGDIRYEVRDMGKTMEAGGRYSETRQSGVLHTDSVQWHEPPDILGLLCLHPAQSGGESVVVSAYSIHNKLLHENPDLLDTLYAPFPFETRKGTGEVQIIEEPVFTYNEKDGLRFRYIGTYIPESSITPQQKKAKKALDELLQDDSLIVKMGILQAGEISFIMNHRMAHGRGSDFVDYPEPERKRVMVRAWLREKNGE